MVSAAEKKQRADLRTWSSHRGSERIGVTRNSNKWQALIMIGDRKRYIGTYPTQEMAAKVFDKYALAYRGLKVTNKCARIHVGTH